MISNFIKNKFDYFKHKFYIKLQSTSVLKDFGSLENKLIYRTFQYHNPGNKAPKVFQE